MKDRIPWRIEGMAISAVLCLLFACFIVFPQTVIAQPFDIMQITNTTVGDSGSPSINADGSRIAFYSTSDLVPGNNVDVSSEIFLYNATTGTFTQITSTTGGSGSPSISADGTRIAFQSDRNIVPPDNADLTYEIFLYNSTTSSIVQITNTPIGGSGNFTPAISADGTRIAFKSDRDIVPTNNADGNFEIFIYNATAGTFIQITDTTAGDIGSPSINADGTRIAFNSNRDLVGGSNADLNDEIFLYNTTAGTFTQITNTLAGGNYSPSIDANGTRIAFYSNRNIVPPNNADGNSEIFLYSTTTGTFTQITNTSGGINNDVRMSSNGTRIAFESNRDLVPGNNADLNGEIFFYDTTTGTFTQITNTPVGGTVDAVSINANGTQVAFNSNRDLTGANTDRNSEIFLAEFAEHIGIPTMTQRGMIIFVVLAGLGAAYYIRRQKTAKS